MVVDGLSATGYRQVLQFLVMAAILSLVALVAGCLLPCEVRASPQSFGVQVAPVPFAQAALWASSLPGLRVCDSGVDDAAGCPARPEHGGAGFLSAVFTWRYALNNLRAWLVAMSSSGSARPGLAEFTLQLLTALDNLMERPIIADLQPITQAARALFDELQPLLTSQPPVMLQFPAASTSLARWSFPSDGRTIGQAAFTLRTGTNMPAIGFGTWRLWGKEAYQPVLWALEAGYRHIDTAEGYANEEHIGRAIHDSGVRRSDVFLATKASSVPRGLSEVGHMADIFAMQLTQLGTDYVDVYMLHTPPDDPSQLRAIWAVMESLYEQGRARALGVSNCDVKDLQAIFAIARIPPVYIQNLFKVYKPGEQMSTDEQVVAFAHANGMAVMGYSIQTDWPHVLSPLQDPHVLAIASHLGRSPSQILHRWALQRGVGVIPKSATKARIIENGQLLDFELSESTMRLLDGIATLSESSSSAIQPHQEDIFSLASLIASPPSMPVTGSEIWGSRPEHGSAQMLMETRDQGFPYAAVRDHFLAPARNLSPGECQQLCRASASCAAWEVCAPFDPQSGCEGCYLIGQVTSPAIRIAGWHAAVERR